MRGSVTRWAAAAAMVALAGVAGCSHTSPSSDCATGVVGTTVGDVCGVVTPAGDLTQKSVDAFLGIPYAESTGGANRFQPPVPKARMSGVFQANTLSPACPQELNPPYGATSISEDCLTVNVWRPTGVAEGDDRPVMLWIYGGSFTSGANQYPLYQGEYVAAKEDVIVVALNYRVGALGFLSGVGGTTGNQGLKDQQLAMHWVKENAASFGGDPDRITIFGESAGAMSVGLQELSIPSSAGLFRSAIQQSNPMGIPYKSPAQAAVSGALFAKNLGCEGQGIECLQQVSVDDILTQQSAVSLQLLSLLGARLAGFLVFAPVVDGDFVAADPTVAAGATGVPLPTLMGTNEADGNIFIAGIAAEVGGGTISAAEYATVLGLLFGVENTQKIIALYGVVPNGDNAQNLSDVATDYLFFCANQYVARTARSDMFAYRFDENTINVWAGVPLCEGQACHADDLPFTFHVDKTLGATFTAAQALLSDQMIGYWSDFAKKDDPNGGGRLGWPRFTPAGLEYMLLDSPLSTTSNLTANCAFWDEIGYEIDNPVRVMTTQARAALAE